MLARGLVCGDVLRRRKDEPNDDPFEPGDLGMFSGGDDPSSMMSQLDGLLIDAQGRATQAHSDSTVWGEPGGHQNEPVT